MFQYIVVVLLNVFFWDRDPGTCAKYHGDKHLHKMIVEYAQIASTAYRLLSPMYSGDEIYKATHVSSNVVQWTCASRAHYDYVVQLGTSLIGEREKRRKPTWKAGHASEPILNWLREHADDLTFPAVEWTSDPPLRMPDVCKKNATLAVEAYRLLAAYKMFTIGLKYTEEPPWLAEKIREVNEREDIQEQIREEVEKKRRNADKRAKKKLKK